MAQQRRKRRSTGRRTKKQKTRRRLWLLLILSVLFLVCLLNDCYQKGMFQKGWREISHKTPKTKKASKEEKEDQKKIRVLLTNDAMNSIYHNTIQIRGTEKLTVIQNGKKKQKAKGKT